MERIGVEDMPDAAEWESRLTEEADNYEGLQDKTERDMIFGGFVPYLKLHCNLSVKELENQRHL